MSEYIKKNTKSMRYGLCMIMAVLLMTACSSEQDDFTGLQQEEGRVALQLTARMPAITMDAATRASGNAWEVNDAIGVFALQHNTSVVTQDGDNVSYTLAEAGGSGYKDFNPTGVPLYLPMDGTQADICAYYPYRDDITDLTRVAIDMSVQTDQKAIDWMSSGRTQYTTQGGTTPISRQNPACQLLFTHRMAKVQFNIINGSGITAADLDENPSMQMLGLSTVGYLNLLTGAVNTNGGTTVPVAPQEMATAATGFVKSYEATILPQSAGSCQVSLTIGNGPTSTYSFIMPARTFEAGKRYIYNVIIRAVQETSSPLSSVTTADLGKVIGADGNIYATAYAATEAGTTASGIIAYVGTAGSVDANSVTYKGLAIALTDANGGNTCAWCNVSGTCVFQNSDIATALIYKNGISCTETLVNSNGTGVTTNCSGHTHAAATAANSYSIARPSGVSAWFLPSIAQWNLIVQGLATKKSGSTISTDLIPSTNDTYKASNLNSVITDAGGTGFLSNYSYWSSTQYSSQYAWRMYFSDGGAYGGPYLTTVGYVRAVFAF